MPEKNDIPIFRNLDGVYYRVARLDMQNVFAIFLFTETNPQPFPCLSLLREYVYLLSLTRTMSG